MAVPDLVVMRSKSDPDLYVITERSRYRAAVDAFHSSSPDDSLIYVPEDRAANLVRGLADLGFVVNAINSEGLYRHRTG
jgi:hypothetical protein